MLDLAARAVPEHMTNEGPAWHNRFDLEYPNVRFAIESGLDDGHPVDSLRLSADLGLFFWLRGHLAQGREWCERSLAAASEADEQLRARGLLTLGELAFGQLDFDADAPPLEEAVQLAASVGDEASVGWAHMFLAAIYANRGDLERAIASRDEALPRRREPCHPECHCGRVLLGRCRQRRARRPSRSGDLPRPARLSSLATSALRTRWPGTCR